ncbi:hypothetical protein N1F89_07680, partial [Aquibium sp. A9E412]|uniref:hypothetical protein n=1 Tax=Aquibium sp. A9E412 TaxID=2976767 RepID=UPI0025B05B1A
MQSSKRRLVILDPARAFGTPHERGFSDRIALAFREAGWSVDWHLDRNDPLAERPYARLHRTLGPTPVAEGRQAVRAEEPPLPYAGTAVA